MFKMKGEVSLTNETGATMDCMNKKNNQQDSCALHRRIA